MEILLRRFLSNKNETMGVMLINGAPVCWTLEDEHRTQKVYAETRIPAGTYKIGLRTEGGHHAKYSKKYPTIHKGMLELQNVPNFQFILIHIGNSDKDTAGCILVGNVPSSLSASKLTVAESTVAYEKIYKLIITAINRQEDVTITIEDKDR